jgi:hypothetical protein
MILEDRSEALHHFFGAYFHQDWRIEHDCAEEIISAFLADSSNDILRATQQQINALISTQKDELGLRECLLKELSCYYCYWNEWKTGEDWLCHISNRLSAALSQ